MKKFHWLASIRALFHRDRVDQEMDEELGFHLECQIQEGIKSGLDPREARRAALVSFGGMQQIQEDCRAALGYRVFDEIRQDLRYAIRQLFRNPGFTILAVLVLALGIGANTAVVSIIDQLVFRPLPVQHPEQLAGITVPSSYLDYMDVRKDGQVFTDVAAMGAMPLDLWDSDHSENFSGRAVSANFFEVLGLRMAAGRSFLPEENQSSSTNPVAIISYRLWQRQFGSNPGAIGQTIRLNGELLTIVGIAPKRFRDIDYSGAYRDIWIPLSIFLRVQHLESDPVWHDILEQRNKRVLSVVARRKPGVSMKQAQARMNIVVAQLRNSYPDSRKSWGGYADGSLSPDEWNISLYSLNSPRRLNQNTVFSLNTLFIATGCLLLISCANVGSLLLARASARQREIASRLAVGASRFRIIRQLLTECLVLSAVSLAWSFAVWRLMLQCLPKLESSLGENPMDALRDLELSFEPRIFVIAASIALIANLIFALVPALLGSRTELIAALKEQNFLRGSSGPRCRRIMVVAQVALSFVLLVGAGLFIRIISRFESVDPGFDTNVLIVNPGSPGYGFRDEKNAGYQDRALAQIRTLPGVLAASWASYAPPEMARLGFGLYVQLDPSGLNENRRWIDCNVVSPGYFDTLRMRLLQGRDFTDYDNNSKSAGVVIVNETLAHQFWPGAVPLGKRLHVRKGLMVEERSYEVIGVVKDAGYSKVWDGPRRYAYFTQAGLGFGEGASTLHVRFAGNSSSLINSIRKVFEEFGTEARVRKVRPIYAEIQMMLSRESSTALMLSIFGGLALLLASVGLYGVISYSVAQRNREFGIRLAMGAPPKSIVMLVIREALITIVAGLAIGLPCSIFVSRILTSRLHGMNPLDPITYAGISILWIGVAILAVLVPARKAISNPMAALRVE